MFILWWSFLCAPLRSCSGISCIPCLATAACDRACDPEVCADDCLPWARLYQSAEGEEGEHISSSLTYYTFLYCADDRHAVPCGPADEDTVKDLLLRIILKRFLNHVVTSLSSNSYILSLIVWKILMAQSAIMVLCNFSVFVFDINTFILPILHYLLLNHSTVASPPPVTMKEWKKKLLMSRVFFVFCFFYLFLNPIMYNNVTLAGYFSVQWVVTFVL